MSSAPGLLTKSGTASYLAMSEKWVQRHRVELGGYLVGGRLRFRKERVDEWLERQSLGPRRRAVKPIGELRRTS